LPVGPEPQAACPGQAQIRNIAKITGAVDHHHVDASARTLDPGFHQTHPIFVPQPAKNSAGHTPPTIAPPIARQSPDLLLQVRCAGFNGKLGSGFCQLFQAVDPASELAMAA
jgi:hypothetical protein